MKNILVMAQVDFYDSYNERFCAFQADFITQFVIDVNLCI